jgi:hypothetical protein
MNQQLDFTNSLPLVVNLVRRNPAMCMASSQSPNRCSDAKVTSQEMTRSR